MSVFASRAVGVGHAASRTAASVRDRPRFRRAGEEGALPVASLSPAVGVGHCATDAARPGLPRGCTRVPCASAVRGVGQLRAWKLNGVPPCANRPRRLASSSASGVDHAVPRAGEEEEALATVRGAQVRRAEHAPFRIDPVGGKVPADPAEGRAVLEGEEPADVLDEEERRAGVAIDAADVGPEPARVGAAPALAGVRGGLAREPASDAIHDATPASSVEGREVAPDRSRIQGTARHKVAKRAGSSRLPLHVTDGYCSNTRKVEPELEPANPGTKSQDIHAASPPRAGT